MKWLLVFLLLFSGKVLSQEKGESRELLGHVGGRTALLRLYVTTRADGSARLTGDYLLLPAMQLRYVEGDRSKQLGVTYLKEGDSPILYGRPPAATLQGRWADGIYKGGRFGPGGQPREQFEFNESFPSMDGYSARVSCEQRKGRYESTLAYEIEAGKLKRLEWRSKLSPEGHTCAVAGLAQQPFQGGLRLAAGGCVVTLRDLGEFVRVAAEGCAALCGSDAYLEPVFVDRDGDCELLPQPR
jgi:hypothetical protein